MIADAVKARGHDAVVRKFLADDRTAIIVERPDVVVIPVVRCEYTRDLATRLKQWGVRVIARRSEAGVSRVQFEKLTKTWQQDQVGRYDYKDLIDLELVWSREFADILVEKGKIGRRQVRVIGGITLDPYFKWDLATESAKVFCSREDWYTKHKLDPNKRTVYFITGFVHADKSDFTLPEAPIDDPIHSELHQRDFALRHLWLHAISKLSESGKYNILVRPHHGERLDVYGALNHGVCVSTEGSAGESLFHSDAMVHAGSTMAIEAHVLGKPAFRFGNTAQDELVGGISPKSRNTESLIKAIRSAAFGKSNAAIETLADLEKSFFGPIDGKAHQRCADAICEFGPQETTIPNVWPADELHDYSSSGIVRIEGGAPVVYCRACQKGSQNFTNNRSWRCPHCGIMITKRI
jgi:surface carbohydrate biosynthesis protein